MAQVNWLTKGERSGTTLITAPGTPAGVESGVERLDAALDGFTGPIPGWFRAFEKLGFWWYPICAVVGVLLVLLLVDPADAVRIASGMAISLVLAYLGAFALNVAAKAQARGRGHASSQQAIAEVDPLARIAPTGARALSDAVLGRDAGLEDQVHTLLWRSVKTTTADGAAASEELQALLARTAPEHAAGRAADAERLEQQIKRLKEDGKI
ncbi:hypothetical protein ACFS27_27985 [Promicromonospora vindobonensis]|uniref:Uncharacterized protein n=1 Tax=Promicromonospora vindobonensis TaxID=195748 RepID=A0ABW5W5E5_9MICO